MKIIGPIPEHIRKLMTPGERKALSCPTSEEAQSKYDLKCERDLHRDFMAWCIRRNVLSRHQRMDRKTSEAKGWPDFQCQSCGKICWVEFKYGSNKLTEDQELMIKRLQEDNFAVLVTDSYAEATMWVTERLGLVE